MNKKIIWTAPAIGIFTFFVYVFCMEPYPVPGPSAYLLNSYAGLNAFPPMAHPLWLLWIRLLDTLPFGTLAFKANTGSALFMAASCALIFKLLTFIPFNFTKERSIPEKYRTRARLLTGISASLLFAFSYPAWSSALYAHYMPMCLFLMLISFCILHRYIQTEKPSWLFVFAFFYCISTTEYPSLIIPAPFLAFFILYHAWKRKQLTPKTCTILALAGLSGLLVYTITAWTYLRHPAAGWMEIPGFWTALRYVLVTNYRILTQSIPRLGWLILFFGCVLPWLISFLPGCIPNRHSFPGVWFLHVLITLVCIAVLVNIRFLVWPMQEPGQPILLPSLLICVTIGYLFGYWYCVGSIDLESRMRRPSRWKTLLRRTAPAGALLLLAVSIILNHNRLNHPSTKVIHKFTDETVARAADYKYLFVAGDILPHFVLAAKEHQLPMKIIDLAAIRNTRYRRYLASVLDVDRFLSVADLDAGAFLAAWMAMPSAIDEIAVLSSPEIFTTYELSASPKGLFYTGTTNSSRIEPSALMSLHRDVWNGYGLDLMKNTEESTLWIRRHMSKVANDLGVLMEDMNQPEYALEAYNQALAFSTNNIVSSINRRSLAVRFDMPEKEEIMGSFSNTASKLKQGFNIWNAPQIYGTIRDPSILAARGLSHAAVGNTKNAIREISKVSEMTDHNEIQFILAGLYLSDKNPKKSEALYKTLIERDPENVRALSGLLQISLIEGRIDEAKERLGRLKALNLPDADFRMQEALIFSLQDDTLRAMQLLTDYTNDHPDNLFAWSQLSFLAIQTKDNELLSRAMQRLTSVEELPESLYIVVANMLIFQNRLTDAEAYLSQLLRKNPGHIEALLLKIQLAMKRRDWRSIKLCANRILSIDPDNYMANHFLGIIQIHENRLFEAEQTLLHCIQMRARPLTMNNLAWVYMETGRLQEAVELIDMTLKKAPRLASAWDTKARIHMKSGEREQAFDALSKALSLQPNAPNFLLTKALITAEFDGMEKAKPLLKSLWNMEDYLSEKEKKELESLQNQR